MNDTVWWFLDRMNSRYTFDCIDEYILMFARRYVCAIRSYDNTYKRLIELNLPINWICQAFTVWECLSVCCEFKFDWIWMIEISFDSISHFICSIRRYAGYTYICYGCVAVQWSSQSGSALFPADLFGHDPVGFLVI